MFGNVNPSYRVCLCVQRCLRQKLGWKEFATHSDKSQ